MKKLCVGVLLAFMALQTYAQGELLSYTKIDSFDFNRIDSLLTAFGAPPGVVQPEYEVDIYRILYTTPYKHPDSLVTVSGAVAIPKGLVCPAPMSAYFHGTASKSTNVPSYKSTEMNIGVMFGCLGNIVALPDYLGMGSCDTIVPIHPYIHAESQANTSINMLRATYEFCDSLEVADNGQLFLFGYSQGGFTTAATLREIETNYSNEFTVTASCPMSGAFDITGAQTDLIVSDSAYATPGYLPYIILGYQSIYGNLYDSIQQIFKAPYDSTMPALLYRGPNQRDIGYINGQCTPVPKDMMQDSVINAFMTDPQHPLRQNLAESHLLGWAPQSPVKLIYCNGDEQVTYLNSENAYDDWTANGAPNVTKADLGNYTHGGCIPLALINGLAFFNSYKEGCTGIENIKPTRITAYPNPASTQLNILNPNDDMTHVTLVNMLGQQVLSKDIRYSGNIELNVSNVEAGFYLLQVWQGEKVSTTRVSISR